MQLKLHILNEMTETYELASGLGPGQPVIKHG